MSMIDWQKKRSAAGLRILLALARQRGMAEDDVLKATGLSPHMMLQPNFMIEGWQELTACRNLLRKTDNPAVLGLQAGELYHTTTFGIFGQAMLSCATLGEAISLFRIYDRFSLAFSSYHMRVGSQQFEIIVDTGQIPKDCAQFIAARGIRAHLAIMGELIGSPLPTPLVELDCPPPHMEESSDELLGGSTVFGAERNSLTLPTGILNTALPQADEICHREARLICDQIQHQRVLSSGLSGQVHSALSRNNDRLATLDQVANEIGIPSRTLRRQLAGENNSFRNIRASVLEDRANRMLENGSTVEQCAEALGFADASSFTRAYRRWTGGNPGRRRSLSKT